MLDGLPQRIAAAAEERASGILADAKAEAQGLIAEAGETADKIREDGLTRAADEAEQIAREVVASVRQSNQKDLLIARREELDATRALLVEEVSSASMEGRASLLQHLLDQAKVVAEDGMSLLPVAIDRAALQKAGSGWEIGRDIDGIGGFMLQTADRSISLDFLFDTLLESVWKTRSGAVNEALFSPRAD